MRTSGAIALGDDNGTWRREPGDPRREVGAEAVHVVLCDVEIDETAMDSDTHRDVETEPPPDPLAERGHFPGDVETGLHRASHVVLMCFGMAEHGEQPVTLNGEDMALVAVDDLIDLADDTARSPCNTVSGSTRVDSAVESTTSAKRIVNRRISSVPAAGAASRSSAS